jgi:hypothetical protein
MNTPEPKDLSDTEIAALADAQALDAALARAEDRNAAYTPELPVAPDLDQRRPRSADDLVTAAHETDQARLQRTRLSSVAQTDAESGAVQKTPHRVTLDSILDKIEHTEFYHPERHPHMTIAILTLSNGYIVVGKSTPADPANFNAELGQKFATEDAIRQIWGLEAYLLREKLQPTGAEEPPTMREAMRSSGF